MYASACNALMPIAPPLEPQNGMYFSQAQEEREEKKRKEKRGKD